MTTQHDERAAFEEEYRLMFPASSADPEKFEQNGTGGYEDFQVNNAWRFWQARAALLAADAQAGGEVVAWAHEDGRVIPAATMAQALKDGGASASSVSGFTRRLIDAGTRPHPQAVAHGWKPTEEQFHDWAKRHGMHPADIDAFNDAATLYLSAAPAAAQVADWRDGVNVARLRAALTRMGIATGPSEEGTAADLENWVNTLTRAVTGGKPAAQVAPPDALRIALEDLDSMEPLGPTTEAVIDAAQRWYLAAPKAAQVAQPLTKNCDNED